MYRSNYPMNYYNANNQRMNYYNNSNNDRVGFLGPFLLGGLAGGLISPFFYNGGYYPNNYNYYYPNQYPYYGPYYR